MNLTFTVEGDPVAKARARVVSGHAFTPTKTKNYEKYVVIQAKNAMVKQRIKKTKNPVRMIVYAYFQIPETWPKWKKKLALSGALSHTSKPDGDNILKICKDSLNNVVYVDDSQVVSCKVVKYYAREKPCVSITVEALNKIPSQVKREYETHNF